MFAHLRNFIVICALIGAPVAALAGQVVTVFAAASLRDAMEDVVQAYDGDVVVSYGGSGQIARQVAQGAPADIIILANVAWMDWLQDQGLIEADNRLNLLQNRMVLAAPAGAAPLGEISADALLERLAGGRLAIGQTRGVPAGIYGRQWLENTGIWTDIAPHLAETENVRAALALIARHETPLGIVYASDAKADDGVVVLYDIPAELHDRIVYPIAKTKTSNGAQVDDFIEFILSEEVMEIFVMHGFTLPETSP